MWFLSETFSMESKQKILCAFAFFKCAINVGTVIPSDASRGAKDDISI